MGGGGPRKENENVTAANRTAIDIATTNAVNGTGELKTDVIFVAWCKKSLKFVFLICALKNSFVVQLERYLNRLSIINMN